ncbi:MAG: hypothetical protein HYZ11_17960 [Candidatus Tectomicrobia bacterium]|uniref:Uncharacterized protein n=1 Tax=Tectimicrobiota bacterium TaxID=2528274 RepID=A0A932I4A9_UNCTE|nr:hypothetical protein [Candidatus Tectomicrobia bacterium]
MPRPKIAKQLAKPDLPPYSLQGVISLLLKGWTHQKVADLYGVSRQAITQKVKGLWELLDPERLEAYEANRAKLLSGVEADLLELFGNRSKREKATLGNVAYAFTQIHQARRLEGGESTANFSLRAVVEAVNRENMAKREPEKAREATGAGERARDEAGA